MWDTLKKCSHCGYGYRFEGGTLAMHSGSFSGRNIVDCDVITILYGILTVLLNATQTPLLRSTEYKGAGCSAKSETIAITIPLFVTTAAACKASGFNSFGGPRMHPTQ